MAKQKQPYVPFYVGDYLKDTRVLPLNVRGAWVDLILFMWDAPVRGELIGTLEDFARMMSCERTEAEFALNLLKQKSTADFFLLDEKTIKIVSRRMKRDAEISQIRSDSGKKGVEAKFANGFAKAKGKAKSKQNTDNDNEVDNDIGLKNKKEPIPKFEMRAPDFTKPDVPGDTVNFPFDTEPMRQLWAAWKQSRWKNWDEEVYGMYGENAELKKLHGLNYQQIEHTIGEAIAGGWKNLHVKNGTGQNNSFNGKPQRESSEDIKRAFAERHSAKPPSG